MEDFAIPKAASATGADTSSAQQRTPAARAAAARAAARTLVYKIDSNGQERPVLDCSDERSARHRLAVAATIEASALLSTLERERVRDDDLFVQYVLPFFIRRVGKLNNAILGALDDDLNTLECVATVIFDTEDWMVKDKMTDLMFEVGEMAGERLDALEDAQQASDSAPSTDSDFYVDQPLKWDELPRQPMTDALRKCCSESKNGGHAGARFFREIAPHFCHDAAILVGPVDVQIMGMVLQEAIAAAAHDVPPGVDSADFMQGFCIALGERIYRSNEGVGALEYDPARLLVGARVTEPDIDPQAKYLPVPVEPTVELLKPFYECKPNDLMRAWSRMLKIAQGQIIGDAVTAAPSPERPTPDEIRPVALKGRPKRATGQKRSVVTADGSST